MAVISACAVFLGTSVLMAGEVYNWLRRPHGASNPRGQT
jgi:hypothetical protein